MLANGISPCQKLCVEDCHKAITNTIALDRLSIVGKCFHDCKLCLYAERFERDDVNWIPSAIDPQYKHWNERG